MLQKLTKWQKKRLQIHPDLNCLEKTVKFYQNNEIELKENERNACNVHFDLETCSDSRTGLILRL